MTNARGTVDGDRDGHHVEPASNVPKSASLEVELSQAYQPSPLLLGHGFGRAVPLLRPPALDLDEHPDVAIPAHYVDLAEGKPHVALHHSHAECGQVGDGGVFRRLAPRSARIDHALV